MSKRITRRSLAVLAGAAGMAKAQGPAYTGATGKFGDRVDATLLDPVAWSVKRYAEMPLKLRFQARTRPAAEAWQRKLRAKLTELVGGFPSTRTPLAPVSLEKREFAGYTREALLFTTRPGMQAFGYLLLPKGARGKLPVVIAVPGHGRGVDDITGVEKDGSDRMDKPGYQHDYALQVVERGMAALAIEPLAFGCRRDPLTIKRGLGTSACQPAAGAALLLGETMIGWRVWDVMRTVDLIETRPELDAKRIGLMGISGGGTVTVFGAALEPRIAAAFASGYLNMFRDCIFVLSHCIDNYVPGLLHWAEMPDIAGLIAPRPFFAESGTKDNIFPVAASRASFAAVKQIYDVFGAGDRCGQHVHAAEHVFDGTQGLPFLAKHLQA
jgi:dienelactone hydrolase